ncbi:MAG TPA: hypothetical protein PKY72_04805 [Bacilli bacterium]|nr:hypothetical protein [Bacilli bacterium]
MRLQNNVEQLLIASSVSNTANRTGKYLTDLAIGEIAAISTSGKVLSAYTGSALKFGYRDSTSTVKLSDTLPTNAISSLSKKAYKAHSNKVSSLAFTLEPTDAPFIRLHFIDRVSQDKVIFATMQSYFRIFVVYDFLKDAVHNLQINSLFKDRGDQWYKMRYGIQGTCCGIDGNEAPTVVTVNSPITFVANSKHAAITGEVANLQDYIAVTCQGVDVIFKVVSSTASYIEVDRVFDVNNNVTFTSFKHDKDVNNLKLYIESLDKPFEAGFYNYAVTNYEVTSNVPFVETVIKTASEGSGEPNQLLEWEWFLRGNEGDLIRVNPEYPTRSYKSDVVSTATYDIYIATFSDDLKTDLGKYAISKKRLVIAAPVGSDASTHIHTVFTALNTNFKIPYTTS